MYILSITFLSLLLPVIAWLPGEDKTILARDGTNLFNSTPAYSRDGAKTKRWLPSSGKIRGVNLGSMFVFEPWIAESAWSSMGCGDYNSEFDCVSGLGQSKANSAFQSHWASWITKSDITLMQSYGLNAIRIPVGYWMMESLVYSDSEHFPQGGLAYLEKVCGWASDAGFYIMIDMHGAPGAQVSDNADTGQYASTPGFYVDYQFTRGTTFLNWLTTQIHSNNNFRNVGMLGIVNEPVQNSGTCASMMSSYYPNAYNAIRSAESSLGISSSNALHIQMMNIFWGSGNPVSSLPTSKSNIAFDDHRYIKWDTSIPVSQSSYLSTSCNDDRTATGESPTIVGEFSISVPDNVQDTSGWSTSTQQAFYKKWFAAQVMSYETNAVGWVFWTWKAQLGDYRWSYKDAVAAGVVPTDLDTVYDLGACDGY